MSFIDDTPEPLFFLPGWFHRLGWTSVLVMDIGTQRWMSLPGFLIDIGWQMGWQDAGTVLTSIPVRLEMDLLLDKHACPAFGSTGDSYRYAIVEEFVRWVQ